MADIKVEIIKIGEEGRDYTYLTSISEINTFEKEEVIVLPSVYQGNIITHLGYHQKFVEAHEVWADYHHPSKGVDYQKSNYKRGLVSFKFKESVKKIIIPKTIVDINYFAFVYCKGLVFEFEEGSIFYEKDGDVYKHGSQYKSLCFYDKREFA